MQLYFIRHAQSVNNALWEATGTDDGRNEDPELTELGLLQARYLAEHLITAHPRGGHLDPGDEPVGFGLTHLYCSLMVRAVRTGVIVAARIGQPIYAWVDLHEEGGLYLEDKETGERIGKPGKSRSFFEQNFPMLALPAEVTEEGWWNRPFEERDVRPERAKRVLAALLKRHQGTDDRVAVISHGGFYNHFIRAVIGLSGINGFWFQINNTAITRIDFYGEWLDLTYLNRTDHLPKNLVT